MKTIYYILLFFPLLVSPLSAQWQEINPKLTSSNIFDIAWGIDNTNLDDNDNVVIAVGGNNLVLRSTDGGQNWSRVLLNGPTTSTLSVLGLSTSCTTSISINPNNFNGDRKQNLHGVAAGEQGHFLIVGDGDGDIAHIRNLDRSVQSPILALSTDNGVTWTQFNAPTTVVCSTCTSSQRYTHVRDFLLLNGSSQVSQDLTLMDAVWNNSNGRWYIIGKSSIGGVLFSFAPGTPCSWTIEHVSVELAFNSIVSEGNFIYFTGTSKVNRVFRLNVTSNHKDSLVLDFQPYSISLAPGSQQNTQVLVVAGGEVANTFDGTYRSMMATAPIDFSSLERRIPRDDNYFVQSNVNWRFGRASKFISTSATDGYIFTDFGRIVKCSTNAMNPSFTEVYKDKCIILSPTERLYCAEKSPNNQCIIVGGQFGNLWRLPISSSNGSITSANTLNTIEIPDRHSQSSSVPLNEEIFDMINVDNGRIWMVGESGKILSAVPPQQNGTWDIQDEGYILKQMYGGKDNDFHGITRRTDSHTNPTNPTINQLWIVGQNKTILFGNIDNSNNVNTWNVVNKESITRAGSSHIDFTHNPSSHLNSIVFSSDLPCLGYAVGGSSLIFRTTDGGTNWHQVVAENNNNAVNVNNFYKVHYIPATIINQGRFIIVGERTILTLEVPANPCTALTTANRETWNVPTVNLLINSDPATSTCENNRHFASFGNGALSKGTQTYILRNIQVFGNDRLFAVGYLLNSELHYNTELWTPAQRGLILTSADRGDTWDEVFPVAPNDVWQTLDPHSGGGEENNNANARLFGITCSTTDAWVCGSSGYIIHSDEPNKNFNTTPTPPPYPLGTLGAAVACITSVNVPSFVGEWGDDFAFQMNGQTLRTMNAICSITTNNTLHLIAAGEQGTIIATSNNNRGWGKPATEEDNLPFSNENITSADYHISTYPNPVTKDQNEVNIKLRSNSALGNHITVELNNSLAELCYKNEISLQQDNLSELSFTVPTSTLQSGVYHICITCNGTRLCRKIVIHK